MKKKYLIIIVIQSVLNLLMLMYAFVQKAEAEKQRQLAETQHHEAQEMEKKAVEMEIKYEKLLKENAR